MAQLSNVAWLSGELALSDHCPIGPGPPAHPPRLLAAFFPVQFCYVENPAVCIGANPSSTYPGAAWRLCF